MRKKKIEREMSDADVMNIFNNNPRENWVNLIKEHLIEPIQEYTSSTDGFPVEMFFTCEEINHVYRFPYEIGDIVTFGKHGGKFILCDYPWLDERKIIPAGTDYGFEVCYAGNLFSMYGILENGKEATTEDTMDRNVRWLHAEGWHYSDMKKIGNVKELTEEDALYQIYQKVKRIFKNL